MPGPAIRVLPNAVTDVMTQSPSVFDSPLDKALRMIGDILGVDDPVGQVFGIAAPAEVGGTVADGPLGRALGKLSERAKRGIRAFHGSPHDFDKFDMSKIGTGEGAQAYGHGLYVAEAEDTAKYYRDALSAGIFHYDGQPVDPRSPLGRTLDFLRDGVRNGEAIETLVPKRVEELRKHAEFMRKLEPGYGSDAMYDRAADTIASLDPAKLRGGGNMYEVAIDADPDDFLDWDKPLSQQSPKVQEAVKRVHPEYFERGWVDTASGHPSPNAKAYGLSDEQLQANGFVQAVAADTLKGEAFYRNLATEGVGDDAFRKGGHRNASERLAGVGVKGIRYKDGLSRGTDAGTHNYVIFDDKLITILRKYGVAGAIGAGYTQQQIDAALAAQGAQQ